MIAALGMLLFPLQGCEDDHNEEGPGKLTVLEYRPAPGQFINDNMSASTQTEANAWAQQRLDNELYVSLGAFGGYITVRMPKTVRNREGYDFGIAGNPFAGSSEPGIVWVSEDVNGNGIADDPWYELKGSDNAARGYEVTYYRPSEAGDIRWKDSGEEEGVISYLPDYHDQMYYPAWITSDSYTLKGSRLEPRSVLENNIWKNDSFGWGYADNMGNDVSLSSGNLYNYNQFDLDNAIDSEGKTVALTQIHFVRVQSAILKNVPLIGEVSTEVVRFITF